MNIALRNIHFNFFGNQSVFLETKKAHQKIKLTN